MHHTLSGSKKLQERDRKFWIEIFPSASNFWFWEIFRSTSFCFRNCCLPTSWLSAIAAKSLVVTESISLRWSSLQKKVSHGKIRNIFHTYLKMTRSFRERPGNTHENIDSTIWLRYLYGCSLGRLKIFQEWSRQTRSSPCNNTAEQLPLECSHFHELDHLRRTSWSSE